MQLFAEQWLTTVTVAQTEIFYKDKKQIVAGFSHQMVLLIQDQFRL